MELLQRPKPWVHHVRWLSYRPAETTHQREESGQTGYPAASFTPTRWNRSASDDMSSGCKSWCSLCEDRCSDSHEFPPHPPSRSVKVKISLRKLFTYLVSPKKRFKFFTAYLIVLSFFLMPPIDISLFLTIRRLAGPPKFHQEFLHSAFFLTAISYFVVSTYSSTVILIISRGSTTFSQSTPL